MSQARKPAPKKKPAAAENADLPDLAAQEQLRASVRALSEDRRFAPVLAGLAALRRSPPQSLLLEGGSPDERVWAALYWAALLNCRQSGQAPSGPCLACPDCLRFISCLHRDLTLLDGRAGNIKIDDVREMRSSLGQGPQEADRRVIILAEGQALMEAAANALLKSLEEPRPGTVFVLTAPQRERLLPTLVSRSWVLTLPWPREPAFLQPALDPARTALLLEWTSALLGFARGGQGKARGTGWMERTAKRGSLDAALAMQLVLLCQSALLLALSEQENADPGSRGNPAHLAAGAFRELAPASLRILDQVLAECQESLNYNVNPALVLDWLATRLFFVFTGNARR